MSTLDLKRRDTICAPATADVDAALAIVRVSGPRAYDVRDRTFAPRRGPPRDFVATLGELKAGDTLVDEALAVSFPEGRSFTGEPTVEFTLHGGRARVRACVAALLEAGCRLATPGEFTLRAVLSGRIDLLQAEAVADVIAARTDAAAELALKNLAGELSARLEPARRALVEVLAELEAGMDFPDEELDGASRAGMLRKLDHTACELGALLETAHLGGQLIGGARVVLFGAPNAGKSTLLNALAKEERALVHDQAGTTRDVLEVERELGGLPITFVDVAGVREVGAGEVEALGVARAKTERERAHLVLHLVDGSQQNAAQTHRSLTHEGELLVVTKSDLAHHFRPAGALAISAASGEGLATLEDAIAARIGHVQRGEPMLTRARQREEVDLAHKSVQRARAALDVDEVPEVICSELRGAAQAIGRLLGLELNEEVLDEIFSRFCIGK